jgi:Inner membrane component of T3SS, cytoplasmic domain
MDTATIAISALASGAVAVATAYVTARLQSSAERAKWSRELTQAFAEAAARGREEAQRLAVQYAVGFVRLESGERYFIPPKSRLLVGRASSCDIPIEDPSVSRQHVALRAGEAEVRIEHLAARAVVLVNGEQLNGERVLRDKDRIRVGQATLEFFTLTTAG